jgi:hypothetical protein
MMVNYLKMDNQMMTGSPREIDVIHQIWLYLNNPPIGSNKKNEGKRKP